MYKPATKSNIGFRQGRVCAWSIVIVEPLASPLAPEGSRSPVSTSEPKQPAKRLKVSSCPTHSVDVPADGVDETGSYGEPKWSYRLSSCPTHSVDVPADGLDETVSYGDGISEQLKTLTRKAKDLDIGNVSQAHREAIATGMAKLTDKLQNGVLRR